MKLKSLTVTVKPCGISSQGDIIEFSVEVTHGKQITQTRSYAYIEDFKSCFDQIMDTAKQEILKVVRKP